jgi:hypothetical protein
MGVRTLEVGYASATTGRGDHEVRKGHVVALEKKNIYIINSLILITEAVSTARYDLSPYIKHIRFFRKRLT